MRQFAEAIENGQDYDGLPGLLPGDGLNSNTAPAAIAIMSARYAGNTFRFPSGASLSGTGWGSLEQIRFINPPRRFNIPENWLDYLRAE